MNNRKKSIIFDERAQIDFRFVDSYVNLSESAQKAIQIHWEKELKRKPHLFNGDTLTVSALEKQDSRVEVILQKTRYDHFLASQLAQLDPGESCRNIYVSALMETSDKKIAIGKMGANSFEPGRFQFIGGGLDLNHVSSDLVDFESCIAQEVDEEVGINILDSSVVREFSPRFLSFGIEKKKVSAIFSLRLHLSSDQLGQWLIQHNSKLETSGKVPEVDSFQFVDELSYDGFFEANRMVDENLFSAINAYFHGIHQTNIDVLI